MTRPAQSRPHRPGGRPAARLGVCCRPSRRRLPDARCCGLAERDDAVHAAVHAGPVRRGAAVLAAAWSGSTRCRACTRWPRSATCWPRCRQATSVGVWLIASAGVQYPAMPRRASATSGGPARSCWPARSPLGAGGASAPLGVGCERDQPADADHGAGRMSRRPACHGGGRMGGLLAARLLLVGSGLGTGWASGGSADPAHQATLVARAGAVRRRVQLLPRIRRRAASRGVAPSLHGVGALAADFYLSTGRMPLSRRPSEPHAQRRPRTRPADRRPRRLHRVVRRAAGAAVSHRRRVALAPASRCSRTTAAGCHSAAARGGIVTGAFVPSLLQTTPRQIDRGGTDRALPDAAVQPRRS